MAVPLGRVAQLGLAADSPVPHEDAAPPAGAARLPGAGVGRAQRSEDGPPGGRREGAHAGGAARSSGDRAHGGRGMYVCTSMYVCMYVRMHVCTYVFMCGRERLL